MDGTGRVGILGVGLVPFDKYEDVWSRISPGRR